MMTTATSRRGPAVEFNDVRLRVGSLGLINGVSLRVDPGTIHALIGPNGAGKTSLLRALLGQVAHTGRIALHWDGKAGTVGYVPQTLDFDRHVPVTVDDFLGLITQKRPVLFGLGRVASEHIAAITDQARLSKKRRTRLGALSGGELKRVLLAQALVPPPDLLVLDEPMNHLDAQGVALTTKILHELKSQGVTIVVTLHDLAHVQALADVVTGMAKGHRIFTGPPSEVLTPKAVMDLFAHDIPEEVPPESQEGGK